MFKILIFGLPGSGKTHFSNQLFNFLKSTGLIIEQINADAIRKFYNDWDFSREGRIRQSLRLSELASQSKSQIVICDFVAPFFESRNNFAADYSIWMDTIKESRYHDTNQLFEEPKFYDFRIKEKKSEFWIPAVSIDIIKKLEL